MKVVRIDPAPQEAVGGALFPTGGVTRQSLIAGPDSQQLSFTLLSFAAGAANAFHTHTHDQVLVVTSGTGVVATVQERREVTVGDVVLFPAGENHWHAASADAGVAFVSVTPKGTTTAVT